MKSLNMVMMSSLLLAIPSHTTANSPIAQQLYTIAQSCQKEHKCDRAADYYRQALTVRPDFFEAAIEAGQMLYNASMPEQAIEFFKKAITIRDHHAELYYNLGLCYSRLNQDAEAMRAFEECLVRNPHFTKAYVHIAQIYTNKNEYTQAVALYKAALQKNTQSGELHYHLARTIRSLDQYPEAISMFERALELEPSNHFYMLDLANTLHMVDEYERALTLYKKVLTIDPNNTEALYNLGFTLKKCGTATTMRVLVEQAIQIHNQVLTKRPDYPLARFARALSYLTLGNFELGWPEYESRWSAYNETPKKFPQPTWTGEDLNGKRIFVYAEQGFGDTFQFVRYCKMLKDHGAYVIMQTQHQLKRIISQCPYCDLVLSDREQIPDFDYHIALLSIPMVAKTTLKTVPNTIPYLYAQDTLTQKWQQKLALDKNFKIGICWQGNKQYRNIFLQKEVASKAMQLNTFEQLASLANVTLYSLQKINGVEQLAQAPQHMQVTAFDHFDEEEGPFMDTAAIMRNLDLVITVDTSVAHLAAGLGVEVWILLPFPADWRWMLDCDDTPWYPNVKLFRQTERGNWQTVMERVRTALEQRIAQQHKSLSFFRPSTEKPPISTHNPAHILPQSKLQHWPTDSAKVTRSHEKNTHSIQELIAHHMATHKEHMEKSEELKELTRQLLIINKQLWNLEKNMPQNASLFDEKFIQHMDEAGKLMAIKKILLQQINDITENLKNN